MAYRRRHRDHLNAKVPLDLIHLGPGLLIAHKRDTDSDPSKSSCPTDPMEVRFAVWMAVPQFW